MIVACFWLTMYTEARGYAGSGRSNDFILFKSDRMTILDRVLYTVSLKKFPPVNSR